MLDLLDFPGQHDSHRVRPLISADAQPHFDGLLRGELLLQRCAACQRWRYPPGPVCTCCGATDARWQPLSGRGSIHSWVRYHRSFLPEFDGLIPYVVAAVRLEEGPVLFGRLRGGDQDVQMGAHVRAVVERWSDGFAGLAFVQAESAA